MVKKDKKGGSKLAGRPQDQHHIWHSLTTDEAVFILRSDSKSGLTGKEAIKRQKYGLNVLPSEKPLSWLALFFSQLKSPLIYILVIAGFVTLSLRELTDAAVIFVAVLVNTFVGYLQERKASNTLLALKKVLQVKAVVLREGFQKEIVQDELTTGDIILLKAGDKTPADARIIRSNGLKMNESILTGEWLASDKTSRALPEKTALADRDNMVFMGTTVEAGECLALVTTIGEDTEIGKVAKFLRQTKEEKTPFQKKLAHFSKIVGGLIAGIVLFIFLDGILTGRPFIEMFLTAVAVAVAAIPEGLPVAMTVVLALGMQRILKKKGLVRKLSSAETLGSTTVIATDKTLTLTEGKMKLFAIDGADEKLILRAACLANPAFIENPKDSPKLWKIIGEPTSKALLLAGAEKNVLKPKLEEEFEKISTVGFSSQHKFTAGLFRDKKKQQHIFAVGAPETLFNLSSELQTKNGQVKLIKTEKVNLVATLETLTGNGLRVIACCQKTVQRRDKGQLAKEEVKNMVFLGFIALEDPLRQGVQEAFATCQQAGLKPIIVTGDHVLTAKAVAKKLGLATDQKNIMTGEQLDNLSDEELAENLEKISVFARVEPSHKMRIVSAWQAKNKVVAMTGDGVNDAAALKKADVGVALGSGAEVAKEASDLILLNDSFAIIVKAIEEGRVVLDNIRKVITYLLSDSFTEIILVGAAVFLKFPLPISAMQILWVNLIEDGLPNLALAFEKKEKDIMAQQPNNKDKSLLTREMKVIIFSIGFFTDFILLGLFFFLFYKFGPSRIDYIRTMIFAGLTIDSLFYIFSCKSLRKNIWKINILSNKLLIAAWVLGIASLVGGIYAPFLQKILKTTNLALTDWLVIFGFGFLKLILIEAVKTFFIVRRQTE